MLKARRVNWLACVSAIAFLFAGCVGDSRQGKQNGEASQSAQRTPMQQSATRENTIIGPVRYLALGDSTGAGVGAKSGGYVARIFRKIEALRPESRLTNRCLSGATTSDVLHEQMDQFDSVAPNLVTVGVGINDIGHGVSLEVFERNYDQIFQRLRANTKAVIVVTNIPEISSAPRIPEMMRSQYKQVIIRYNKKLEEIAARHNVTVFDVYGATRDELPNHPEYFSSDGFHPSDQGYELWAETMWPTIAQVLGEGPARP